MRFSWNCAAWATPRTDAVGSAAKKARRHDRELRKEHGAAQHRPLGEIKPRETRLQRTAVDPGLPCECLRGVAVHARAEYR